MKKILVLIAVFFSSLLIVNAQATKIDENKVPKNILKIFKEKYSEASSTKWTKTKKSFDVEFKLDGKKCITSYDVNGFCTGATIGTTYDKLPDAVKKGFENSEFKSCKVNDVMESSTNMEVLYYIYVKCAKKDRPYVCFTPSGEIKK